MEQLPEIKRALKNIDENISKLEKDKEYLRLIAGDLERITEFYNGVPIYVQEDPNKNANVRMLPDGIRRATIYCSNSIDYKICLFDHAENGVMYEKFVDFGFSRKDALEASKEWVANGVVPK